MSREVIVGDMSREVIGLSYSVYWSCIVIDTCVFYYLPPCSTVLA